VNVIEVQAQGLKRAGGARANPSTAGQPLVVTTITFDGKYVARRIKVGYPVYAHFSRF
jgi:hypothetical protein